VGSAITRWREVVRRASREHLGSQLVLAIVASRLLVFCTAALASLLPGRGSGLTWGAGGPVVSSLSSWDGFWYLGIAQSGYHAALSTAGYHDYAFLPLYPALVRVVGLGLPDLMGLAGIVASNAMFVVALVLLVKVGEPIVGEERARLAATYLAISPFGFVFSMTYGESLGLALSIGAFLAAQRDRRALCGILLALAALTRLQAVALIIPLGLLLLKSDGWRPRRSLLWLGLGPVATVGFILYVANLSGSMSGFFSAMGEWGRTGAGATQQSQRLVDVIAGGAYPAIYLSSLLVVLCAAIFLLVYLRPDRIPLPYAVIPILYLVIVFASGQLMSIGRYILIAFPYVWILAGRNSRAFRLAWPIISFVLLGILSFSAFRGYYVP
jgi:hypothetical protein